MNLQKVNESNLERNSSSNPFERLLTPSSNMTPVLGSLAEIQNRRETGVSRSLNRIGNIEALQNYGITPNFVDNVNDQLAESQSNWSKLFNALSRTIVSEIGLGTVKAFSDIADGVVNGIGSAFRNASNDYTNPVSKTLEEWKEKFDNDVAPIYTEEGVNIFNGGFSNFGWWMENIPSIASSITLLIPGKAVSTGVAKGLRMATKGRATAKAMKSLRKATGVESLTSSQTINAVKQAENLVGTALVMRTAENYQEARGTYKDMKDETINKLNSMTPEQYTEWINNHKDYLEKNNINPTDKESIADRIASDAANETFKFDFWNTTFDVIQLWALRDASKIFRKVKSTKVMEDHRASIEALGKTSEELAEAATKSTKFSRLGNTVSDIVRGTGKATLSESTEGIEEAINFIAQQEGMTVGKSVLEDLTPTTFNNRLNSYMSDPQLWESAFWGLAGGVVFHGLGSAYNQYQTKKAAKKDAESRKENTKTGESVEASKWYELEELPEIKAARQAVKARTSRVEDMVNKMADINNGINVFGKRDETTHALPKFEGSADAIALQQDRARSSVIDQFVADITTDAVHSGTYDLLKEYLSSPEMTKAIAQKLNLNENEATTFVNDVVARAERVKNEYNKQINHISDQVAAINADSKNKDSVPLPYIQILAKQNLDRILTTQNLDNQGKIIQDQINTLRSNPAFDGILDSSINYEDVMTIGSITSSYSNYEAQKKAIKADDSINPLTKLIQIDAINKKQTLLLRELESITTINGKKSSPLGRILYTLKAANVVKYNEQGQLVEDKDAIEQTDKEILKNAGYTVTEAEAEDAAKSFSEYTDTLSAFDNLIEISKREVAEADKAGKELKEISDQLYNRYKQLANIRIGKLLNGADIATTKTQIAEQIDIIHNQNNENRKNMIKQAENKILDLYTRYERPVIDNLMSMALDGHQEQAKALAKQQLTNKEDDGVMFEDAFDILHINSDNNIQLASYIKNLIDGKEWIEHIQKLQNEQREKSSTPEEQISDEEKEKQDNKSDEIDKTDTGDETTSNGGETDESKIVIPENAVKLIKPYTVADTNVASIIWNDGAATFYNDKGLRIGGSSMTAEEFEDLTGVKPTTISSTGGQEEDSTLTSLKDSLNRNFDYLEIKGEDDIEDNKEFDVDAAVNSVKQQGLEFINSLGIIENYTVTDEAKNELRAILEDRAEALKQRLTKFKEEINKENPTIDEAANALAMASKIGILGNKEQLPNLFVVGFEKFVDTYIKSSITPIKDGKKVISIQEILNIVSDVVADPNISGYVLDKMRTYLKSPEVAKKYVILDIDNLNKDFNIQNSTKDNNDIEKQDEQFRVNILDYVNFYSSTGNTTESQNFFNILNNLKKGDILDLVVDGDTLYIKQGTTVIGGITKAYFNNNKFTKINKGWVEDVTVNAGGDIISDTMETYKRIFTDDSPLYSQLRNIIIDAIVNKEVTDKIIDDFIKSDFISSAVMFSDDTLLPEGGNKIEKNAKQMIEHLVKIYNYSTQNATFRDKQERINSINYAIENYFASLYNDYDILNRINKDTKIKISYINDGQVDTMFESGTNHHDDLPFISSDMIKSKGKLAFYSQSDSTGTEISGEEKGPVPPNPSSVLKILAMYDRNGAISYVTVKQLKASDFNLSPGYGKVFALAKNQIQNAIESAVSDKTNASYNTLASLINNLIYNTSNDNGNIPLFVGLPSKMARFKYDVLKGEINLYFQYTRGEKPTKFSIFKNNDKFTFKYSINGIDKEIKSSSNNFERDVATIIMDIIKNNSMLNIDLNGIKSDNNPSKDITSGFVHRINGKIEVFGETYDSYNDFIINNGLARVNLNKPKHDSNFISEGREQRLNQVMYVSVDTSLPVEETVDTNKYNVSTPSTKTTNSDIFNSVSKSFENTTTSGKDLFIAAYGEEAYNDMLNVAGEFDIMEAILPTTMVYNPNLNSAENSTLEAKTNPTNHTIRVNVGSKTAVTGRTRVNLAPGQVMVGDKFISMLSNIDGALRNRAVAVMIHERLHWLIENNPHHTRKEILDNIRPIYDEFFKLCQEVVDNYNKDTATNEDTLKYRRANKAIEDFKRYNNKKAYPDELTKYDEFLVESITNIDYNALLNDFKASEQTKKGEDNIFTKLMKFVMKYLFGREIKNGTLLEQEFNTLSNILNNKQVTVPVEQKTEVTVNIPAKDNKRTFKKLVLDIDRSRRVDDTFDDEDEDSAIGILNDYNTDSITGFVSVLPIEQQVKFNSLLNNGQLEYKCVIK